MTHIPDVVIKNGRIVTTHNVSYTRVFAGMAMAATLIAAGLGGYLVGQSNAQQKPAAPSAPLAVDAPFPDMPQEPTQTLQSAVMASLQEAPPPSENDQKFVQAQHDYLNQNRETPAQIKARLDRLAADPQALDAHNRTVMNRVTARASTAPSSELTKAVEASHRVLQTPPKDAVAHALKTEAAVREAEGKTYVVRPGDTLWAIAQRIYGDPYQYKRLFEANPRVLAAPEHIFPGQVLRVPT